MNLKTRAAFGLLAGLLFAGCGSVVEWRYYAPFRVIGKDRVVSPVDPAEVSYAGVASRLHYLSVDVDSVFFRNLPGTSRKHVALGIELTGATKDEVKTVTEPVVASGRNGLVHFEKPLSFGPFLYTGKPLRITLTFRDVTPAESKNLLGRIQGLGLAAGKRLIPAALTQLSAHATQFEAFLGKSHKGKLYTYTFSLYPSDMEGVRPDLVVTGGRHVFVGIPSSNAPEHVNKVKPADLVYKLQLAGRRLQWREGTPKAGQDYTESPYVLMSLIRYKRYPVQNTPLRKAILTARRFIEEENWSLARSALVDVGKEILVDKSITQLERNLEIARRDVRTARIDLGVAQKSGDKAAVLAAMLRQIKLMGYIGKDFQQILEPFEVKRLRFRVRRLTRQALELAGSLQQSPASVTAITKPALASIKMPPEAPSSPLTNLKPPKVVKVTVTKPEPFYKKWWFYALLGVAGAGALSGGAYAAFQSNDRPGGVTVFTFGKGRP